MLYVGNPAPRRPCLSDPPPLCAQVFDSRQACGRVVIALRRRALGVRSCAVHPSAKGSTGTRSRRSANASRMCQPPGQRSPPALRRRVPVNPGRRAGDAARVTAAGRAAGCATVDLPPRPPKEAWSGIRRKRRCDPARRPRPAHAGSQVGPPHGDAICAVPAVWASTRCLKTGRAEAVAKGVNAARGHFWPTGRSGAGRRRPQGLPWA